MYRWLPEHLHPKLLGQSTTGLNYRVGFGDEQEGSYNHCNKDLEELRGKTNI